VVFIIVFLVFLAGVLPIPVGYERGKVRWVMWCGTGMHGHIVDWKVGREGRSDRSEFQTLHPKDYDEVRDE
jgi:hypothetical protein